MLYCQNNTNMESVELKEVHMGSGITNSQSFNVELDDGAADTAGFRVAPSVP
ncbi:gamma-aminobutyric acid receptor subunit beta, partial [Biomphalaria pfeifferi]